MADDDIQIVKLPLEESPRGRLRRSVLVVALTVLVSAPGFALMAHDRATRVAETKAFWKVEGPPCPPLSADRFRDVQRPPSATPYDGAIYERHGGVMTCTHRTDEISGAPVRYPVCKFSSPDYLAVSVGDQERLFDLSMGRSAAVSVVNGQVRCAVTPKFQM